MKESISDIIGKEFELIRELRESQKKTDDMIRSSQKKTDEHLRETGELIRELRESQKETEELMNRTFQELRESQKKTDEKIEKIWTQLGDMGSVQGQVAEDLFYRNVRHLFGKREMEFTTVLRNLKKKGIAEYDIVAINKDKILVVEVKNKLERRMVDNFITKRIPKFREVFPEYRDYDIIGGVGSLMMKDDVSRYAEKQGLYVLTQKDDGGATLINPKNFRAKEF